MSAGVARSARAVPHRTIPAIAGTAVLAFALPVFVIAGWNVEAWAIAAVLWLFAQTIALLVERVRSGGRGAAAAGVTGAAMFVRATGVMVVLIALAASDAHLALSTAALYALAYTSELALSVAMYFGGES